jgi:predicted RecB family nuclease
MSDQPHHAAPDAARALVTIDGTLVATCPVRTQWDLVAPAEPAAPTSLQADLAARSAAHRQAIIDELRQRHSGTVVAAGEDELERAAATRAAMAAGAPVIARAVVPVDPRSGWTAPVDLLVRVGGHPVEDRWRYLPARISRRATAGPSVSGVPAVVRGLEDLFDVPPRPDELAPVGGRDSSSARRDLVRLAHAWRVLHAQGAVAPGEAWAGIIDRSGELRWYPLDDPRWPTSAWLPDPSDQPRSILALHDQEVELRTEVAAQTLAHLAEPELRLPLAPVRNPDCPVCPWREHCLGVMEQAQELSLLPRLSWADRDRLHAAGITDLPALAAQDPDPPGVPRDLVDRFGPEARARLGDAPAYLRPGVTRIRVPRADVELDVDMENVEEGVYLWGVLTTDRTGRAPVDEGYRAYATWEPELDPDASAALTGRFWDELHRTIAAVQAVGLTVAAYCWYEPAENRFLRAFGDHTGRSDEVEAFIGSPLWVDLAKVASSQLITGRSMGLKTVAPLAGFAWRDTEARGDASMVWYRTATDPTVAERTRADVRSRLLAYNEDDVLATRAVREWLATTQFPNL